jgi:NarL family two-component system response regulator LiaR
MAIARKAEGGTSTIKVLIVDDHDLFRAGLTAMLSVEPDIEIVGQASRGRLGVNLALELRPDVVLMDIRMPDLDGINATREILAQAPLMRIIAITVASDEATVESAIRAGACGYLLKESPVTDTIAAVHAAARGDSWLSPRAASAILDRVRRDRPEAGPRDPFAMLSPRETEILRLLSRGMENSEIARELSISPRTAKNHISSVLAKLGMSNRVQAAIYAVRHGLE